VTTTITGPAFIVPATLAPELAQALALLRRRYVTDAIEWPAELADLEGKARSVVSVMRDRPFPTGRPNDQPKREMCPEMGGNDSKLGSMQAATRLGITDRRVRQLATSGLLEGARTVAGWEFTEDAVEQYERTTSAR